MSGEPFEITLRAPLKQRLTDKLRDILDLWIRGYLAGLMEGAKMSNEQVITAMICTFRRINDTTEGLKVADNWEQGIALATGGDVTGRPIVVDLNGKIVPILDAVRLQFYAGRLTARSNTNVDGEPAAMPEQWPTPQLLAQEAHERHRQFVVLVQTAALSLDCRFRMAHAAKVLAAALGVVVPDGDVGAMAEEFVAWKHAEIAAEGNTVDWRPTRPAWLGE